MLLPEVIVPGTRMAEALQASLRSRPCWRIVSGAALLVEAVPVDDRDRVAQALLACDVLLARRRHSDLHGPVGGFALTAGAAVLKELVDFDVSPSGDGDLTSWARAGLDAIVFRLRMAHPDVQVVLPDGLPWGG